MDAEILLACSYAGFLVLVASVLELTARYVHGRAQRSSTHGFTFIPEHDAWKCPAGRHLHRESGPETFRIVKYRAQSNHCNACSLKPGCTDSNSGRVLEHQIESWMESGIRRFHRGMSLALLVLAAMILTIEIARHPQRTEQMVLGAFALSLGVACMHLARSLRRSV